jgi:hypothetical protein
MTVDSFVVLLHVAIAFWFVAGLLGRAVALAVASRAPDLSGIAATLGVARRFERVFVMPGSILVLVAGLIAMWVLGASLFEPGSRWLGVSLAVFLSIVPLVPLVFLPRGRRFDAALAEARERGAVTARLRAAFRDPAVMAAHVYEGLAVTCVLVLMVTKPF